NWINDRSKWGGRAGYEYFPDEDNYLFTIAHFYSRMCAYMDYSGWMHKQFLGAGEFTLDFGDYTLSITVPSDHIVAATGEWSNASSVLSSAQQKRLAQARTSTKPVMIVTPEEALDNEKERSSGTKTWVYKSKNVRDVAFASSRKFIWDAMNQPVKTNNVLCMSYYPKEGNPLWEQYSTKVVAHTIKTYSKFTADYIYPVAISVHTDRIGMEYPMICFNGPRPEKDGTYSKRTKYGLITVIIHEVGHNWFPMIVNSDERQWTWMDEGLNTYCQFLAEQSWEKGYESSRGEARRMVRYMTSENQRPIMTGSEEILQFGNNAYSKTTLALTVLRESVLGRDLFDFAFREYCRRWAFK
ncbi:MAG: M1 family peptidase, partial [Flavobacteriales bacterium]|nr:M1 family peptidase [Flavobacteriales bacterium]